MYWLGRDCCASDLGIIPGKVCKFFESPAGVAEWSTAPCLRRGRSCVWVPNLHQCLRTCLQVCGSKRLGCYADLYQNKLSLLICFRKKCPLLVGHLQLKETQSIEVKQRISHSFDKMVFFVSENIGNSQNILKKIHFHIKVIKAWTACLFYQ